MLTSMLLFNSSVFATKSSLLKDTIKQFFNSAK